VIAASGYISYLLLMRRHDKQLKVFWVSVMGWLMPAALLFSVIGAAVRRHRRLQSHLQGEYTQAFYYGVFSAGLYALVALLLAVYVMGALRIQLSRHNRRRVQRTDVLLRSLWLGTVLLVGAAIYRAVEGWPLLDALYFADYTILTIGIGNLVPTTHLGRSLLFPYAATGIVALGLMVSSMLSFTHDMHNMRLRLKMAQMRHRWTQSSSADSQDLPLPRGAQVRELHHIKAHFHHVMHRRDLIFFLLSWLVLWFLSAAIFRASEAEQDWSYFIALYFTYTSLTTIGYGDLCPTSNLGKVFFVFWSLLALPILTNLVTATGEFLHQVLVFCSSTIWKHCVAVTGMVSKHCISSRGGNHKSSRQPHSQGIDLTPSLASTEVEGTACPTPSTAPSIQGDGISQGLLRLLIVEEMDWLTTILRDGLQCEDLGVTWSRIVPLLHSGEQDIGPLEPLWLTASSPPSHLREQMMRHLELHHHLQETNTEILWMLTFLIHKLRADLGVYGS
jgi:hypothetical protein